ncbi:NAD(P)-binding protein [Rubrobacter marinus]|uniref:NAD(P)-binding protein n=1 Tax=Rubrobacter marinus TaxID=2653852 RepID=A0A6G8PY61_9ACTN|nr:FAD-dependent oxidoreductase [Rubrobacter marinus]QIN79172.1 NAD(P)-binding protein [Rubrobacter marinus]
MSAERTNTCLVIGAGMSGLLAANKLQEAGWAVTILDKGRGVGGRMATRRFDGASFDHGAQFFTARSDEFKGMVADWQEAGAAREWSRGFADAEGNPNEDGHPRYRGAEGMTSVPKHLARGLDVRTGEKVVRVDEDGGTWRLETESGTQATAGALIVTAPVPQALEIVGSGEYELPGPALEQLEGVSYDPCLALMALLDGPSGVPEPGGVQIKGEPLDWIGDNGLKGISRAPAVTIHAGPQWSREHYEDDEAEITAALLGFAGEFVGSNVVSTQLARWRYSWVSEPHPEPFLLAQSDPALVFCGDSFAQPKVEGASLSGLAAAGALLGEG